jgi:hypothetical protein
MKRTKHENSSFFTYPPIKNSQKSFLQDLKQFFCSTKIFQKKVLGIQRRLEEKHFEIFNLILKDLKTEGSRIFDERS